MEIHIVDLFSSLPERFRREKAGNYSGTFHFDIPEHPFTVAIESGICTVTSGLQGEASCRIRIQARHYIAIETGELNPQMALFSRKLIVSNLPEMMRFSGLFRRYRPSPSEPASQSRPPLSGPLSGIRILDLSRLMPGPLATSLLANLGAEVIKIEDPGRPDETRDYPPHIQGHSAYYLALNSSKKNLTLNLYSESGKDVFRKLAQKADIIIESFRPGVMQKIGIDYSSLSALHPELIMVSVTGYGQEGPYAQDAGHDLNYIGYAGILGLTGQTGGPPIIPGPQVADIAGGSYMTVIACLTALQQRQRSGRGDHVDVSMLDATLPLLTLQFARFFATGTSPARGQQELSGSLPNYQVYPCADGKHLALGALEPRFFKNFCEAVNHPEWANDILPGSSEAEKLQAKLSALFKTRPRKAWLALAQGRDLCLTPVYELDEVVEDPHLQERKRFISHHHPAYGEVKGIAAPLSFRNTTLPEGWAAPLLGEDTAALLDELGYSQTDIQQLREKGVI